jgi:hypothetical protein
MRALLVVLLALVASDVAGSQAPPADRPQADDQTAAWTVEVSTTGGFTGRGNGGVIVRANGAATCIAPLTCEPTLSNTALRTVSDAIGRLRQVTWTPTPAQSICADCFVTRMVVRVRAVDGTESRTEFSWNDVTYHEIPDEVRTAYTTVRALGRLSVGR